MEVTVRKFAVDFETTTRPTYEKEGKVRVWAYSICEIGNPDHFEFGNNIDSFMDWCADESMNPICYFHNAKFDLSYVLNWLFVNDFTWIKDKKDRQPNTFTTLITDMGVFYALEVFFDVKGKKTNSVKFLDSLKILNFSVADIAKSFDLPISKLKIDYDKYRPVGYELDETEVAYIRNDVEIMARALDIMFKEGYTKMTIASDAFNEYKDMCSNFNHYFPVLSLDIDKDIRKSYKGGFTYLNEKYKEKEGGNGITFDVNSLYPSVMASCSLPFGEPEHFDGDYQYDPLYNLYVINFTCIFDIKEGMLPTIQDKSGLSIFKPNEYLKSSNELPMTLTLTSVDFEMFKEHYNIRDIVYHGGWKFKSTVGLFNQYVTKHTQGKIQAKKDGNKAQYLIHKLMQNSLYGRYGLNPNCCTKQPYFDKGVVKYKLNDPETRDPIYIPMAAFITSYARQKTIGTSQKIREWSLNKYEEDLYVYSDTDSIHMLVKNEAEDVQELSKIIDIDDYRLGAWKLESRFKRGKWLRQKCYIEQGYDDSMNVTVAGLPKKLAHVVNFDNFKPGFTTADLSDEEIGDAGRKLTYNHVRGGVLLDDTDFTIK